jgi:NADH dehydrogenase
VTSSRPPANGWTPLPAPTASTPDPTPAGPPGPGPFPVSSAAGFPVNSTAAAASWQASPAGPAPAPVYGGAPARPYPADHALPGDRTPAGVVAQRPAGWPGWSAAVPGVDPEGLAAATRPGGRVPPAGIDGSWPRSRRRSSWRGELAGAAGALVLLLDAGGHAATGVPARSLLSPPHILLYACLGAAAVWTLGGRRAGSRAPARRRRPARAGAALAGAALVAASLVLDATLDVGAGAWAAAAAHPGLLIASAFLAFTSLRKLWNEPTPAGGLGLLTFAPVLLATGWLACLAAALFAPGWGLRGDELLVTPLTVALVFTAPVLLTLRRWRPPFGTLTLLHAAVGVAVAAATPLLPAGVVGGALAAGLAADLAAGSAAAGRASPLHRTALAQAAAFWVTYFVVTAASSGQQSWRVTAWLGTIAWAGLCAAAIALLVRQVPTASRQGRSPAPTPASDTPAPSPALRPSPMPPRLPGVPDTTDPRLPRLPGATNPGLLQPADTTDPRLHAVGAGTSPGLPAVPAAVTAVGMRAAGPQAPAGPADDGAEAPDEAQPEHVARPRQPYRTASAISAGLVLGLLWWVGVPLTLQPALLRQSPTWTVEAVAARFPDLIGSLFGGAVIALGVHLAVEWMTVGRKPPADLARYGRTATKVVILGGGFAGVSVAKQLEQLAVRYALDVTLVSKSNYLLFTPMLAEVAARSLEASSITAPVRAACPRTKFRCATVEGVDQERRLVHMRTNGAATTESLPYDHLVLALGAVPNYLGLPGVEEHSFPFKTLHDATRLHNHVIGLLEEAEAEADPVERRRKLTFVVAGGGFAGSEVIASIHDLVHEALRFFPRTRPEELRFVLVHSRERILPELGPELAAYSLRKLRRRGIEFLLKRRVTGATAEDVTLTDGQTIPTRTLVWTAGNQPNLLLAQLPFERYRQGALVVGADLRVRGHQNVWALGDCALVPDQHSGGDPFPATAQHAMREGRWLARNIAAVAAGRSPKPFSFRTIGYLVSLGRQTAAAELRGLRFSGLPAWLLWRGVYLSKLPGFEKRLRVLLDWTLDLFSPRDITLTSVAEQSGRQATNRRVGRQETV